MSEVLWPPDIAPASQDWQILGNVGVFESPLNGAVRTVSRKGARLGCRVSVPMLNGTNRARLMAVLGALRDRSNVIWMPDFSTTLRGSFSAPELLANNDFSNGTTGWTVQYAALTVSDRVARLTASQAGANPQFYQSVSVSQYVPYALRSFLIDGEQSAGLSIGRFIYDGTYNSTDYLPARGLGTVSLVSKATASAAQYPAVYAATNGYTAGSYVEIPWSSMSRCIPVDGGANAGTYSDQFDNAAWIKSGVTVIANYHTGPDATAVADSLIESNSSNVEHYVYQNFTVSSAAQDITFSVSVGAITRGWCLVRLIENTGAGHCGVWVNLLTGALGTTTTGTNWSNVRASIVPLGNGWYRVSLTGSKTNAATSLSAVISAATADASYTYAGSASTDAITIWRGCFSAGSVPTRGAQTTTAGVPSGATQNGASVYVKGLPVSTSGLLRAGDFVSCGGQGNIVTASLDSDAAGLGVLQCALPWRSGLADNAPIMVNTPLVKMRLAGDIGWQTGPGKFSPFELELVEDVT